jgi:hypothetical protein
LRLNVIAAYVLDRQYIERRDSIAASRLRYQKFVEDNRRDSASEPDDEADEPVPWTEGFDVKKQLKYWINGNNKKLQYTEPDIPLGHENGMVGVRVKVFWVVQQQWYSGVISGYHRRKQRHRIDYDDGDHEWMDLEVEHERVQVEGDDGSWMLVCVISSVIIYYYYIHFILIL